MLNCEQYLMPETLEEALQCLVRYPGRHRIIAGGTDLLPQALEGAKESRRVPVLVDISRVAGLTGVELRGGRVWAGANTTLADCLRHPLLRAQAPLLARCAAWFGDDAVRETATLGGNLVNASPAADGTTALLALNASVTLSRAGPSGENTRELPLADFVQGPGSTAIQPGEILTAIAFDALGAQGAAFEKTGRRRALVLSTVCLAVVAGANALGTHFKDVRLALGGCAPVPVRLTACEQFLEGRAVDPQVIRAAAALPMDPVQSRTRREYRREVLRGFVERGLLNALAASHGAAPAGGLPPEAHTAAQGGLA